MSHAPLLFSDAMVNWLAAWSKTKTFGKKIEVMRRFRPSLLSPVIALLRGLTDPVVGLSMGQTAEILAWRFGISREQMDHYAVESHQRLNSAQNSGNLEEIEIVYDKRGSPFASDDGARVDSTVEKLATLKPVFDKKFGNVTAGNSAQVSDGAAWLILASEDAMRKHKLEPIGRIIDSEWAGVDPAQMGLGPVHAVSALLKRHQIPAEQIDYWELNEAFAAQVLACLAAWKDPGYCRNELGLHKAFGEVPHERLNVDGGGISLGHPVGASGTRIILHLLRVLKRNNAKRGVATLCVGGGQGGAILVENMTN
jgi:acetyl-CoA C-acetyltransferase